MFLIYISPERVIKRTGVEVLYGFQKKALNPDGITETVIAAIWEGQLLSHVSLQKAAGHGDVRELDRSSSVALANNSTAAFWFFNQANEQHALSLGILDEAQLLEGGVRWWWWLDLGLIQLAALPLLSLVA